MTHRSIICSDVACRIRSRLSLSVVVSIVCVALMLAACGADNSTPEQLQLPDSKLPDDRGDSLEQSDSPGDGERIVNQTPIPSFQHIGISTCDGAHIYLSLCDWAKSLDGIAVGYVKALELVRSPAKIPVTNGGFVDADDCDGRINPGLKVTIEVDKRFGTVGQEVEELDIYMGRSQFVGWSATPLDNPTGEVEWQDSLRSTTPGAKIDIGQFIGFPIHYKEEDNIWTLMGEQLFSLQVIGDDAQIQFQGPNGECMDDYPEPMNGMLLNDFFVEATACENTSLSVTRKRMMENNFGRSKERYMSASCLINSEPTQNSSD